MPVTDVRKKKSPHLPTPAHPLSAKGGDRENYNSGLSLKWIKLLKHSHQKDKHEKAVLYSLIKKKTSLNLERFQFRA